MRGPSSIASDGSSVYLSARSRCSDHDPIYTGSMSGNMLDSEFSRALDERGLRVPPEDELNWSGRPPGSGQHVEFDPRDEIPLKCHRLLGESRSARVEAVKCRRIWLARKLMRLNRRLTLAEVMNEVQHLQKLCHPHIVKLVGSYLQGRNFALLIYPVANCHLGEFLAEVEKILLNDSTDFYDFLKVQSLQQFMPCLVSAVSLIHSQGMKHMDIKPANILVKEYPEHAGLGVGARRYCVLVADFGISRSFISQEHSQTESRVVGTPKYCSPEVYLGLAHGRAADMFSLGTVFIEILTVLCYRSLDNFADFRNHELGEAYCHNVDQIHCWADELCEIRPTALPSIPRRDHSIHVPYSEMNVESNFAFERHGDTLKVIKSMLHSSPARRPAATDILVDPNRSIPFAPSKSLDISTDVELPFQIPSDGAWVAAANGGFKGYELTSLIEAVVDTSRPSLVRLVLSSNDTRLEMTALERALRNGCKTIEELVELGIPFNGGTVVHAVCQGWTPVLNLFLYSSYYPGLTEASIPDHTSLITSRKICDMSLVDEVLEKFGKLAQEDLSTWAACLKLVAEVDDRARFVTEMLKKGPSGFIPSSVTQFFRSLYSKVQLEGSLDLKNAFAKREFYRVYCEML